MAIDATKVRVGTPDQLVTGAVMCAPLGTKMPDLADIKPAAVTIDAAFQSSGYVSEDGLTVTPDYSTADITDWSGSIIRRMLESFDGKVSFKLVQVDEDSFKMAFGDDHVEVEAATKEHGTQLKAAIGAHLPEARSWVFKMKDGQARMLVTVPNGQVTSLSEITFAATDAVGLELEVSCYPDESGESIYILSDDGQLLSASSVAEEGGAAKSAKKGE